MKQEINWNKQAEQFLKQHNWRIENKVGFHPCYPLGEGFSMENSALIFCKEFYSRAWESYKSYIKTVTLMKGDK